MKKATVAGVVIGLAMALSGCQTMEQQMLASGFPPEYAKGYEDGCGSSGTRPMRKDMFLFKYEEDYKTGWTDGYNKCQADYERIFNALGRR